MWAIYTVIVYFALALLLPVGWVLVPVWRRARAERQVACPDAGATALVALDPWYAARGPEATFQTSSSVSLRAR